MYKAAKLISAVFSPLWMPTYAIIILLNTSYLVLAPAASRWIVTLVMLLVTGILPLATLIVMKRLKMVSDIDLQNRTQRTIPFAIIFVCYLLSSFFLSSVNSPGLVVNMMRGASLAVLCMIIISRWWKISAHAAGSGALVSMIGIEAAKMLAVTSLLYIFVIVVALAGLVGTSRVVLGRHDIWQVLAGWALGATCVTLFTLL